MGRYYNKALIAVERTGDGVTTILQLRDTLKYPRIYEHKEFHRQSKQQYLEPGFPTTPKTRPIALNKLNWHLLWNPELYWDSLFLAQCLTFVRQPNGIPAASTEAHDDAIAGNWVAEGARLIENGMLDLFQMKMEKYVGADALTEDGNLQSE